MKNILYFKFFENIQQAKLDWDMSKKERNYTLDKLDLIANDKLNSFIKYKK